MEPTWILLNVFVLLGMCAVCLCFVVLMPFMGNLLASMWGTVMGEQIMTRGKGSGTDMEGINS